MSDVNAAAGVPAPEGPADREGSYEFTELRRLLNLARSHLGVELAWISLAHGEDLVISAVAGPARMVEARQGLRVPRSATICTRVLDRSLPGVIPDTRATPAAAEQWMTEALDIGSYVGAELRAPGGPLLGMLCCVNRHPDADLDDRSLQYLKLMADLVTHQLNGPEARRAARLGVERHGVETVLAEEAVQTFLQPVVRLPGRDVVGFEALARFPGSAFPRPDLAFEAATRNGLGIELELLAARHALRALPRLALGQGLAVNFSAAALLDDRVQELLSGVARALRRGTDRFGVELTEHTPVDDYDELLVALEPLRSRGIHLAVDDAGAGYASFRHILNLRPHAIKIDMSLIRDIDTDEIRRALARSLVTFATDVGATLVAEGVETRSEAQTVTAIGVHLTQGYLYGRPAPLSETAPALERAGVPAAG